MNRIFASTVGLKNYTFSSVKCIPGIVLLTTGRSPIDGEFDFLKGQIPTNSPSKPWRGVVGLNIDRCTAKEQKLFLVVIVYTCTVVSTIVSNSYLTIILAVMGLATEQL